MAYNPIKDSTAGYISRMHQDMLETLKTRHKRTKRAELEAMIEYYIIKEFGYKHLRALIDAYEADRLAALQGLLDGPKGVGA